MTQLEKALLLTELADRLIAKGSWCGRTHLQKAAYLLQNLLGVELGVEYMLYKHGPYSFDFEEELVWSQSNYLFEKEFKAAGYGPRLLPTTTSKEHRSQFPRFMKKYDREIEFVAQTLGTKGVTELEKLATALWVTRELGETADTRKRAERIHALKPHVSVADALEAVQEFDQIASEAEGVTSGEADE